MKNQKVSYMDETTKSPKLFIGSALGVLLIAVCLLAYLATRKPTPAPAVAPTAVVTITDQGFVPAYLSLSPGTKVTWHNQTASPHRVASNPFPDHSDLPGLDSVKELGPDESYSYTFTKVGSWGYTDYSNPTVNGSVTVR